MTATGRVWRCALKHQIDPGLLLLAAVIAQAQADAERGDRAAAAWLRSVGF
jgi:hypothetical protein